MHLNLLKAERLVKVISQGKHRYYTLSGVEVAAVLEGLLALSAAPNQKFVPNTPNRLCAARTCYDHIAGTLGVTLHDRVIKLLWLTNDQAVDNGSYALTPQGGKAFNSIGIDVVEVQSRRRRFEPPCLDWSERRPHLGGGMGAALLTLALKKKWVNADIDSRALSISARGRQAMREHFGVNIQAGRKLDP